MISSVSNVGADVAQSSSTAGNATAKTSISLDANTIESIGWGMAHWASVDDTGSLFSTLNTDILDSNNLAGVQGAIDKYTASLPSSNLYDSPYTAPSAQFLKDLTELGSAASAGNLQEATSDLATAKLDAPTNVSCGMADAKGKGDLTGATGLLLEARANIADYLGTQGYSSTDATAEANALEINSLAPVSNAASPSAAQTRLNQITDLAVSATKDEASAQHGANPVQSDPMFNIVYTLLGTLWANPTSVAASNQALALLDATYGNAITSAASSATNQVGSTTAAMAVSDYA